MSRCESCGMPLNDATRGTEADGTRSSAYCLTCYATGAFTAPDAGVEAVRDAATRLTSTIESLQRWA